MQAYLLGAGVEFLIGLGAAAGAGEPARAVEGERE
jgi:hypothetical protein